jgi:hypothetical protein
MSPSSAGEQTPEKQFAALLAKMPSAQREAYLAQLPKKNTTKDAIVLPPVAAVQVSHLPARAVTSQPPLVRSVSVPNPQKVRLDQLAFDTLQAAFGDHIPEV